MLKSLTGALAAVAAFGGLAGATAPASAMPMIDPAPAVLAHAASATGIEQARWVCGPYRCFHRPDVDYRPFFHPWGWHPHRRWVYWHRPYGWHPWHHPHFFGWHHGWRGGWHRHWHGGWRHHGW